MVGFLEKIKCINSNQLKLFAIIIMTIDHIGAVLFPYCLWLRIIGRLAFPIFAFMIVEGMYYTSDAKKYLIRLGVFALIAEIPFDLTFYGKIFNPTNQNIFFTLFLGGLCIYILQTTMNQSIRLLSIIVLGYIAQILGTDYAMGGVFVIVMFYFTREKLILGTGALAALNYLFWGYIQNFATLAMIPIALYNGKKGKYRNKISQYFFYVYYPAHLLVLFMIDRWWM